MKRIVFLAILLLGLFSIFRQFFLHQEVRVFDTRVPGVDEILKKTVPLSIVVPLDVDDLLNLNGFLNSLKNQTVLPLETIIVLSGKDSKQTFESMRRDNQHAVKRLPLAVNSGNTRRMNRREVARSFQSTASLLQEIPNVRVLIRSGQHLAGSNRVYGYEAVSNATEVVCFFDGDDYMHPQRTEIIYSKFEDDPDLHALLHQEQRVDGYKWNTEFLTFLERTYSRDEPQFPYSAKQIKNAIPDFDGKKWDINNWRTEPSWPEHKNGWKFSITNWSSMPFPRFSNLKITDPNNGWHTIRKGVLEIVPYPVTVPRGQDSLFNYRVIKTPGMNLQYLPAILGLYVRRW